MKKILIINSSFGTGGIQSSLVNMANELQKEYQVDLFIYYPEGPMRERIDPNVHIISGSWRFNALGMSLKSVIKSKDIRMIGFRLFSAIWAKLVNNKFPISCAIHSQKKLTGYDMAIAYRQEYKKHSSGSGFARVAAECVDAKVKIAWLHYDNNTLDLDSAYNNQFYEKMDRVVCVSQALAKSFVEKFPEFKEKIDFCYNFIDYDQLRIKSLDKSLMQVPEGKIICFSACRLTEEKALVRAVRCLAPVFKDHPELVWYIAGDGSEREKIEQAISEEKIETQVILLGQQNNPYSFMKNADLVMNLSYHEAAPMVFLEAKALGVPVFATRTSSTEEFLEHGVNAIICENDAGDIQLQFANLVESDGFLEKLKDNLCNYIGSNDLSLRKISGWME